MNITSKHALLPAVLLAVGMLATPALTMPATAVPAATQPVVQKVVNGDFETPAWTTSKEGQSLPWIYVNADNGTIKSYYQAVNNQGSTPMPGLTAESFAWRDLDGGTFELHREADGNTCADVHVGRTVAQSFDTVPGSAFTVSFKHSGRSKGNAGSVQVLAGPDAQHLKPIELNRRTVSPTGAKYGDKTGPVGDTATTRSDSTDATEGAHAPWDHSKDWETYEGTLIIPADQTRTMFAYRGVGDSEDAAHDSVIDDLSVTAAYPLGYDANGAQNGVTPQQTK